MGSEESRYLPVPSEDLLELKTSTKYTRGEVEYLYTRFRELGEPHNRKRFIVKKDFHFSPLSFHTLILNEMFGDKFRISFVEFAKFLHLFRKDINATAKERINTKNKKLKLLFSMYDTNKDGDISKYDLLEIVHKLLSHYTTIGKIAEIVDVIMKEMDLLNMNRILFAEFCAALEPFDLEQLAIKFPVL